MEIHVNNLGAIKEGTFDLTKRFSIFCGPNGTGKTYLAYVIYGLLKRKIHIPGKEKLAETLVNKKKASMEIDFSKLAKYRDNLISATKRDIDEIFGIGESDAMRIFKDFSCTFSTDKEEYRQIILQSKINTQLNVQGVNIRIEKESNSPQILLYVLDETIPTNIIGNFRFLLDSNIYYMLSIYPIGGVEIFPVERNSIYTFSKELSIRKQDALDHMQMLMNKKKQIDVFDLLSSKRYPMPIRDGLNFAEDLTEVRKYNSPVSEFAKYMEKDLLHGNVQISSDGDIQFKPSKSPKTVLPIQMTASVIKTLSSLDVYLNHKATPNDLIIIDEPEINLHPDNQIMVARMLVRLMNQGFRILISTHSDYIIREINNMVMMSNKESDVVKDFLAKGKYTKDEFVSPKDLGVYYFNYATTRSKQIKVEKIAIEDSGFSIPSIDKTIQIQNEFAEDLYYGIKYGNK